MSVCGVVTQMCWRKKNRKKSKVMKLHIKIHCWVFFFNSKSVDCKPQTMSSYTQALSVRYQTKGSSLNRQFSFKYSSNGMWMYVFCCFIWFVVFVVYCCFFIEIKQRLIQFKLKCICLQENSITFILNVTVPVYATCQLPV